MFVDPAPQDQIGYCSRMIVEWKHFGFTWAWSKCFAGIIGRVAGLGQCCWSGRKPTLDCEGLPYRFRRRL